VYAIEYALVFLIFFALIYTIICYAIVFTFRFGLQNAAEDGARAALRVRAVETDLQLAQRMQIAEAIAQSRVSGWLPVPPVIQACVRKVDESDCPVSGSVVPAAEECGAGATPAAGWTSRCQIIVRVTASNFNSILPPFPGFALPDALTGQASMLLDRRTL